MIVVIADDFTGAAELGGIGLRHRLSVEIVVPVEGSFAFPVGIDLLVIATDTRSMKEEEAVATMEAVTRRVALLQPSWIYKKTDSVLRGYVVPEIRAQLRVLGLSRALLIPANPALGRTIHAGHYFLNGEPVHHSAFSVDPDFPVTSSDLQDMLHVRQAPVAVRKLSEELPDDGIVVGEVQTTGDLADWAGRVDPGTFLAGASGFFSALLLLRTTVVVAPPAAPAPPGSPALFVSGSTFDKSRAAIRKIHSEGGPVSYMPAQEAQFGIWCEEVIALLLQEGKAIVAIREESNGRSAAWLKNLMAKMVQRVLESVSIKELTIEGGATAYAILQRAGLRTFFPVQELAPGVIRMKVQEAPSLYITVKPGSYNWPI